MGRVAVRLAFFTLAALVACTSPDDDPDLGAATQAVSGPMALHVEGHHFVRADGTPIWLAGTAVCCSDTPAHPSGWPWVSSYWINETASRGGNWVTMRLGPPHRDNECQVNGQPPGPGVECAFDAYELKKTGAGVVYRLLLFRPAFWSALVDRLAVARAAGVYVELDLIDTWTLEEHGNNTSPWRLATNANGVDLPCDGATTFSTTLPATERRWLEKIGETLQAVPHDHVIFQVANEKYDCGGPNPEWESAVQTVIRGYLPDAVFATNLRPNATGGVGTAGYVTKHVSGPIDLVGGRPTGVNETNNDDTLSAAEYTDALWRGFAAGTFFHYWWGNDAGEGDVKAALDRMGAFQHILAGVDFRSFAETPVSSNAWVVTGDGARGEFIGFHRGGGGGTHVGVGAGGSPRHFAYDWFRASDGGHVTGGTTDGTDLSFAVPSNEQLVLHVRATGPIDPPDCNGDGDCDEADGETAALCPDECDDEPPIDCPAAAAPQSFSWSPASPGVGEAVTFTADAGAITPGTVALWDLGTGQHTEGTPYTHAYNQAGTYTVVLTSNDATCHGTVLTSHTITVHAPPSPTCAEVAAQMGWEFAGCGTWEQTCDNHPGAGSYSGGSDCGSTVCCGYYNPPPPTGQSCGAIGGDYCSPWAGWCPGGFPHLGPTYDCAECCDYVDVCASDSTHDHGGSCGHTDECGHVFGSFEDCGCGGAPTVYDTCWNYTCDDEWAWHDETCTGTYWTHEWCEDCWNDCHMENYDDWVCDWTCGSRECNWTEQTYEYACGGWWEVVQTNCRWDSYECNPHPC